MMRNFTKMWRVKHGEPLTYNERIINSACDIIEQQDERISLATGGIDALSVNWDGEAKKDILAIKQTLEP